MFCQKEFAYQDYFPQIFDKEGEPTGLNRIVLLSIISILWRNLKAYLIVFLRIETWFKGWKIIGRFARRKNEIFFSNSSSPFAIVRGHLSNDCRHLLTGFFADAKKDFFLNNCFFCLTMKTAKNVIDSCKFQFGYYYTKQDC